MPGAIRLAGAAIACLPFPREGSYQDTLIFSDGFKETDHGA